MQPKRQIKKTRVSAKVMEEDDSQSEEEENMEQVDDHVIVKDRLNGEAKEMKENRSAAWNSVQLHEKEYKKQFEEIDAQFKQSINEAFFKWKEMELFVDDEIARYIDAVATTVNVVETTMQHISHYLEKRHGGPESIRHDQACKGFFALAEGEIGNLVQALATKDASEQGAAK